MKGLSVRHARPVLSLAGQCWVCLSNMVTCWSLPVFENGSFKVAMCSTFRLKHPKMTHTQQQNLKKQPHWCNFKNAEAWCYPDILWSWHANKLATARFSYSISRIPHVTAVLNTLCVNAKLRSRGLQTLSISSELHIAPLMVVLSTFSELPRLLLDRVWSATPVMAYCDTTPLAKVFFKSFKPMSTNKTITWANRWG